MDNIIGIAGAYKGAIEMMTAKGIYERALTLPPDERRVFAEAILYSIEHPPRQHATAGDLLADARRRLEQNAATPLPIALNE